MKRVPPVVVLAILGLLLASHAWADSHKDPARVDSFRVRVRIVDEAGAPVQRAVLRLANRVVAATDGTVVVDTDQPVAGVVRAPGYLPEPVVLSRNLGPTFTLRLWATSGSDGTPRVAFHFAGDTMLGRRFEKPIRTDTPLLGPRDGAQTARAVVSDVAPLFAAADVSTVNLETVIGNLPRPGAYSAKRFLLLTPPSALAALKSLGVDVATLGNNHANDWEDRGIASTREALTAAGLAFAGAGSTDAEARTPVLLERRGQHVGVLSYTTVTGDFVNDNLPTSASATPDSLPASERWQYSVRAFGFGHEGDHVFLRAGAYRAGDAWRWFHGLKNLDPTIEEALWRDLRRTYPELQDWVTRRGHSGAAAFSSAKVKEDVSALRQAGATFVVVEIHGGFQFSDVASAFYRRAAHASVDAGADIVVGHHPHVLQGFEWYRGHLVIHSLGNFVFDQDFLMTFPSMFVRAVVEGNRLLEVRVYPLILDRYRPVPVAGDLALRILRELRSDSDLGAPADRTSDGVIARVPAVNPVETDVQQADVRVEGNSGVVVTPGPVRHLTRTVAEDGVAEVPLPFTIRPDALPAGTEVGIDLLRIGDPDDVTANMTTEGGEAWDFTAARRASLVAVDPATGNLGFRLKSVENGSAALRPVARIMRKTHRFRRANSDPADGTARYTVRLRVRSLLPTRPYVRFDLYRFDDSNPLRDPVSQLLRRVTVPLAVPTDGRWHTISVDVPKRAFMPAGGRFVNSAMVYLGLPKGSRTELVIDRLQVVEWRNAETFPPGLWLEADALVPPGGARSIDALVR